MSWLKHLFSRRNLYEELSEEIREHLEQKVEESVADGMPREEAISAARREFGNVTLIGLSSSGRSLSHRPSLRCYAALSGMWIRTNPSPPFKPWTK